MKIHSDNRTEKEKTTTIPMEKGGKNGEKATTRMMKEKKMMVEEKQNKGVEEGREGKEGGNFLKSKGRWAYEKKEKTPFSV